MKKVKLRGYFEANLGDDLFLSIICNRYPNVRFYCCGEKRFKKHYSSITNLKYIPYDTCYKRCVTLLLRIASRFSKQYLQGYYETENYYNRRLEKSLKYNVLITGSGFVNNSNEYDTLDNKYQLQEYYYNTKPFIIGCNFGPFYYEKYLNIYHELFSRARDICFRDSYSANLFSDLANVRFAPDIVFSFPVKKIYDKFKFPFDRYMLISVANLKKDSDEAMCFYNDYITLIKNIIVERAKNGLYSVLLGFSEEQKDDVTISDITHEICLEYKNYMESYCYPAVDINFVFELFYKADSVICTRYHSIILAMLFQKKLCAISYNEKAQHVLEDIDAKLRYLSLHELRRIKDKSIMEYYYSISPERLEKLVSESNDHFKRLDEYLK